jgi:hypothetical protein
MALAREAAVPGLGQGLATRWVMWEIHTAPPEHRESTMRARCDMVMRQHRRPTDCNIDHTRTRTHTHTHTRTRTHSHTRTHAHTHTRTHTRTHAHARTHAQVEGARSARALRPAARRLPGHRALRVGARAPGAHNLEVGFAVFAADTSHREREIVIIEGIPFAGGVHSNLNPTPALAPVPRRRDDREPRAHTKP